MKENDIVILILINDINEKKMKMKEKKMKNNDK